MMMAKSNRFSGGYYGNAVDEAGESEGSGSSGPIDTEITVSENSSVPARRCISLNSSHCDSFGVPMQLLRLSDISPLERKDLVLRLRSELEQIRLLQKKVELQRTNGVALSSSSDILSCSNGHNRPQLEKSRKSLAPSSVSGKQLNPTGQKPRGWNRGSTGKFESGPKTQNCSPIAANTFLMKQCETLLKRLMGHQYAWVFNTPVDVVKLNLPDYHTIIKHPMDLGTVKSKITSGAYSGPLEFCEDVKLTFSNAMTYNPPSNDVHVMAATLSKYFEVRWKAIEKKIPKGNAHPMPTKSWAHDDVEEARPMPPSKKRKTTTIHHYPEAIPPAKKVMTDEEKQNLSIELESLLAELPGHIVEFLKEQSSNGRECGEDEIEIYIDDLSDDTLFTLRKLLDEYMQEKRKSNDKAELCEIELLNDSGPSNLSLQPFKGDDDLGDEDVDIGGNEPPVTSYPPLEIEKDATSRINKRCSPGSSSDSSGSSDSESKDAKAGPVIASKVEDSLGHGAQLDEYTQVIDNVGKNQPVVGWDQVDDCSKLKLNSFDLDQCRDGDSAPRQVSPDKLYRAALLKNRFADTILKAREKTLTQGQKGDPEKLHRERERLEVEQRKEKARLQAEAKAAEDARKRAEAEAAAEARRKRELDREAARQALEAVEKSVVVDNSLVLKDLEMLRTLPDEQRPSSVDEMSPDHSPDGLGSFKLGSSNPLEQLGLYMKMEDEDEFAEPPPSSNTPPQPVNDVEEAENDVEEGEID